MTSIQTEPGVPLAVKRGPPCMKRVQALVDPNNIDIKRLTHELAMSEAKLQASEAVRVSESVRLEPLLCAVGTVAFPACGCLPCVIYRHHWYTSLMLPLGRMQVVAKQREQGESLYQQLSEARTELADTEAECARFVSAHRTHRCGPPALRVCLYCVCALAVQAQGGGD